MTPDFHASSCTPSTEIAAKGEVATSIEHHPDNPLTRRLGRAPRAARPVAQIGHRLQHPAPRLGADAHVLVAVQHEGHRGIERPPARSATSFIVTRSEASGRSSCIAHPFRTATLINIAKSF